MRADLPPKEKETIIINEFENLGYDIQQNLRRPELEEIIDAKTGHKFDAEVMDELYSNMRKDPNGETTLEDFTHVWLEADNRLRSKIDYCDRLIDEYHEQREEAAMRLGEAQGSERMNANGIMEGSQLVVNIGKGQNFYDDEGQPFNPYIILNCENQRFETQATATNNESYTWNEEFNIPIQHANTNLEIHLFSQTDEPELMISVPLEKLRDQLKHEEIFPLNFMDGRSSDARLECTLQWIHSNVKFLTDVIKKWDASIQDQKRKKSDYEDNLNIIYEPFDNMRHLQIKKEPVVAFRAADVMSKTHRLETPFAQPAKYSSFAAKILFYLMVAYFFLSMFNCFYRCVFYDIWIALGYLSSSFFDIPVFSRGSCLGLLVYLAITLILDIIWLWHYTKMWWSDIYIDDYSLLGLRKWTVFLSWVIFFIKIALAVFLWILSQKLPKRPKNLPFQQRNSFNNNAYNSNSNYGSNGGLGNSGVGGQYPRNSNFSNSNSNRQDPFLFKNGGRDSNASQKYDTYNSNAKNSRTFSRK